MSVSEPIKPGLYAVEIAGAFEDTHDAVWGLLPGGGMVRIEELRPLPPPASMAGLRDAIATARAADAKLINAEYRMSATERTINAAKADADYQAACCAADAADAALHAALSAIEITP